MHLSLKNIEKAYGSNSLGDDNSPSENRLTKKSLGELLLRRAMDNDAKIEDDAELMQKLKNMEQTVNLPRRYNPIIDKIIDFVNLSSTEKAETVGEGDKKGRENA